jgi:hypothetical protein
MPRMPTTPMMRRSVQRIAVSAGCVLASLVAIPRHSAAETHEQTGVVTVDRDRGAILGFCVPTGGGLVAVTGAKTEYGAQAKGDGAAERPVHRVVWFAADGSEERAVDLDFAATVAGAAPDGGILVAGDGVVVRLSPDGTETARGSTLVAGSDTDEKRAEFVKTITEKHESHVAQMEKQLERARAAVAEAEKKIAAAEAEEAEKAKKAEEAARQEASADQQAQAETPQAETPEDAAERAAAERRRKRLRRGLERKASSVKAQLRQLEAAANVIRQQSVEQLVEQALAAVREVRAISASRDAVFIVTPDPTGFSYAAWRLDAGLGNLEKIASGLRGCCGQVDLQVYGERLAIAANSERRVNLFDFAGTSVGSVGGGEGEAGFNSGCCNPMNTCMSPDGCLLTSESNGVVKRFDAEGKFVEVVGRAKVQAGCKNSTIAVEPDGSRLYYLDVNRGRVIVLDKVEANDDGEAEQKS